MPTPISRDELQARLATNDAIVLEALTLQDYEAGHIPGALHIDMDHVAQQAAKLAPEKQEPVVTYCASTTCQNSTRVAEALERLGYTNVYEYVEGKADWEAAGLLLVPGA
jgi:rhodanese-related sulfurtransferase